MKWRWPMWLWPPRTRRSPSACKTPPYENHWTQHGPKTSGSCSFLVLAVQSNMVFFKQFKCLHFSVTWQGTPEEQRGRGFISLLPTNTPVSLFPQVKLWYRSPLPVSSGAVGLLAVWALGLVLSSHLLRSANHNTEHFILIGWGDDLISPNKTKNPALDFPRVCSFPVFVVTHRRQRRIISDRKTNKTWIYHVRTMETKLFSDADWVVCLLFSCSWHVQASVTTITIVILTHNNDYCYDHMTDAETKERDRSSDIWQCGLKSSCT